MWDIQSGISVSAMGMQLDGTMEASSMHDFKQVSGNSSRNKDLVFQIMDFPGDTLVKNSPAKAGATGDAGSIPVSERSPGG